MRRSSIQLKGGGLVMLKKLFFVLLVAMSQLQSKEYKAVFDCSSNDASYIVSRMFLVERTMDMIEKQGDSVKFALTIHGKCANIVSKNIDEVVFDENKVALLEKAKVQLVKLMEQKGVDVTVCAMSLNANTIAKDDVIGGVHISKNSFIETIAYQNDGYALMTFK